MNVFGLWEEAVVPRNIPHGHGENMLMLTPPRKGNSRPEPFCSKVTTPKLKHTQINSIYLHYYFNHQMWNDGAAITAVLCDATGAAFILSIRDLWWIIMRSSHHISSWLSVETCTLFGPDAHADLARVFF